ncbi:hypothetical protein PlfCFBP13513_15010 [Plantibacter flavus]|uniref:hypothetical protein n=1 Tax=Plantibacter TaxID=190323 RepID=UPI0010C19A06|nr:MULTISPECIES: hypothetical protein [Plantibacter]MBD8103807.1 hypothetical protein [Plantibacter sp. CFBP 8775]MBD8467255.1 hypothetical protein [Plantibacter sp. CFBP 8798]TKJ96732.1 hypothetical protein PlfCFBP13513_15010 [Plantibacter flavus]
MNRTGTPISTMLERRSLTPALVRLIENACRAERTASGTHRRGAFRDTRYIIGAVLAAGFVPHEVAKIIGVKVDSVHARRQVDGRLTVASARALMEMSEQELRATSLIVRPADEYSGPFYRTVDIVTYLCAKDEGRV